MYLEQTCGTDDPDAGTFTCDNGFDFGIASWSRAAMTYFGPTPATPYTVWVDSTTVDSATGNPGPYALEVQLASTPANDLCTGAVTAALNASRAGTTLGAFNNYDSNGVVAGPCGSPDTNSADVVYKVTAASANPITVTVRPEKLYDTAVFVMDACTGGGPTPGLCVQAANDGQNGDPETITFTPTAGHDYFIVVDGTSDVDGTTIAQFYGARGGFTLEVSQQ